MPVAILLLVCFPQGRTIEEIQELMAQGSVEDPVHAKLLSNY